MGHMKRSAKRRPAKRSRYALQDQVPCWMLHAPTAPVEADEDGDEGEDEDEGHGDEAPHYEDADVSTDEDAGSWPHFDDDAGDESSDEDAPSMFHGSDYLRGDSSAPGY